MRYYDMDEAILLLLGAVGHLVRELSVELPHMTEATLEQIFSLCPNVESLRVKRARFQSMEVFTRAYEVYNLPLSSLSLSKIAVEEGSLQQLLQSLQREGKLEATLERLSLGKRWPHQLSPDVFTALGRILAVNKTLTHLHYYVDQNQEGILQLDELYNGQIVEGISTRGRRERLVLLGRLGCLLDRYPQFDVDDLVKQLIFQFAEPMPIKRKVVGRQTRVNNQRWLR